MITDEIFALSPSVRYVALYRNGTVESHQKAGLDDSSAAESDKYEELFVNPILLRLVQQRGNLDCGGARYVVVRYGNFFQLVIPLPDGHVSICFEPLSNPLEFADRIAAVAMAAE